MTPLAAHGISINLPQAWEGRIGLRSPVAVRSAIGPQVAEPAARGGAANVGTVEQTFPVTHLANFPLPVVRGDYGSGAVDVMGDAGVLVALVEFGPECVGTKLFDASRPVPRIGEFGPNALQRRISGQLGYQRFFTENGRAFCLYLVVGSIRYAPTLVNQTRTVLTGTRIEARTR